MPKTKKQSSAKKACLFCKNSVLSFFSRFIVLVSIALFLGAMTLVQLQTVQLIQSQPLFKPLQVIFVDMEEERTEDEGLYESASKGSKGTVVEFFTAYNNQDFVTACDLLTDSKCDADSLADVERFSQEYDKLADGYNDIRIWVAEEEDFHSDVVCAQYSYQYAFDVNQKEIQETLSFYVKEGSISARVCEEKLLDGEEGSCPILSKRDFCLEA